jgi:hypothetical protein
MRTPLFRRDSHRERQWPGAEGGHRAKQLPATPPTGDCCNRTAAWLTRVPTTSVGPR